MRRQYNVEEFKGMVNKIKSKIPVFNFTTDIMVGFPGESDVDFQDTCNVVKEIGFTHVHTFKYSVRQGTRAERMTNQIPEKIKSDRSIIVRYIAEVNKRKYRSSFIGKTQSVLVEKINSKGIASGYGEFYLPVKFKADTNTSLKDFRNVEIIDIENKEDPSILANPINN